MKTPIAARAMEILREYCKNTHNGNVRAAAEALGMDPDAGVLHRWLRGGGTPTLQKIGECLDRIGAELLAPWDVPGRREEEDERVRETLARFQGELEASREQINMMRGEINALERILRAYQEREMEAQAALRAQEEFREALEKLMTVERDRKADGN